MRIDQNESFCTNAVILESYVYKTQKICTLLHAEHKYFETIVCLVAFLSRLTIPEEIFHWDIIGVEKHYALGPDGIPIKTLKP